LPNLHQINSKEAKKEISKMEEENQYGAPIGSAKITELL
jgi:hypothetical protein